MTDIDRLKNKNEAELRVRLWIDGHVAPLENDLISIGSTYFTEDEIQEMGPEMAQEIDAVVRLVNRSRYEDLVRKRGLTTACQNAFGVG